MTRLNDRRRTKNRTALAASLAAACLGLAGCGASEKTVARSGAPGGQAVAARADKMAAARGGPAAGKRDSRLEAVALFDGPAMPVGITFSKTGRTFMSFPRWQDPVDATAVELVGDKLVPFPDAETNKFDLKNPLEYDARTNLVSVQALIIDGQDRLWLLDPGSINFGPNLFGGPKLWAYDINTRQRVKAITFPTDVAMKRTALNDVRFDLARGPEGTAYITDSGVGGIIVVDLASGRSWRHLDGHPSVMATPGIQQTTEGQPLMQRKPSGEEAAPAFQSDGIALSPDGKTLYYTVVAARDVWSVPTDLLADPAADERKLGAAVQRVATKPSGNDGIACDAAGRIYTTDAEDNAIRRVDPATGRVETVVQDERLLWPDTLAVFGGHLYVTSNQLARQPSYHFGKDQRRPPYALFRLPIPDAAEDGPTR